MHMRTITFAIILLCGCAWLNLATAQQTTPPQPANHSATVEELVKQAKDAYNKSDHAKSALLYQEAIAKGARDLGTLYDAACSLALAGDKEKAFVLLNQAVAAGWRRTEHMKTDSDLAALHDDPRWPKLLAASDAQQAKYEKEHGDPDKARFVTEDITRFWAAYDKAMAAAPAERQAIFQSEYIAPGTVGLKDFSSSGRLNAKTLTAVIAARPNFFKAIRPLTLGVEKQRAETVKAFHKFKQLYPAAIFPTAYFVIGQLSSGGTASNNGLLMGAEMFARTADVPMSELTDWHKSALMEPGEVPPLVAHEAVHFQQKYPLQIGLLCDCLKEGSADFLGELTSGRLIKRMQETHVWANARERELWEEFQKDMTNTPKSSAHWLYGNSGGNGRPVDLGYWMGYKISAAYYKNAADKRQAVRDILIVKDCQTFLQQSRYAEQFASGQK